MNHTPSTAQLTDAQNAFVALVLEAAKAAAKETARAEIYLIFKSEPPIDAGRLLPFTGLCKRFQKNPNTVKVWFWQAGKLGIEMPRRIKTGKSFLYDVEAFEDWIEAHASELRNA